MAGRHLFVRMLVVAFLFISCTEQAPPDQSSEQYQQAVSSFYLALAAIQADQAVFAAEKMNEISEIYPQEPAVWANLGVFSMRRGNFELAAEQLGKAAERAPKNYEIQFLLGILESRRGNIQTSIEHLNNATELAPDNVQVLYSLISELERQDVQQNADRIKELLSRLRELQPNNLAVILEMTRIAAKLEAPKMLEKSLGNLSEASNNWPQEIRTEFEELEKEILAQPIENLTFEIAYLRNNLNQLSQFENDFDRIELPPNQVGFLITEFLWLPEPSRQNEAPDLDISFEQEQLEAETGDWDMAFHLTLAEDSIPDMMTINGNTATFLEGPSFSLPTGGGEQIKRTSLETFDYNYDFLNDLVFVGSNGIKIFEQIEGKQFREITGQIGLASSILNDSYSGVWKADFDLDGDLDLVLARGSETPRILRNNGDGTFSTTQKFADVGTPVHFSWADIDADGDADAIFLNESGELVVYANERVGEFSRITTLPNLPPVHSFEVVDLDSDSYLEIAALTGNTVERVYLASEQGERGAETVADFEPFITDDSYKKLFVQDFDNNGGLDFIISGDSESRIWLSDEQLNFNPLDLQLPGQLFSTTDMTGNNRMDMIGLNEENIPYQLVNSGTMGYNGRMISPRASGTEGDQRINSFGIGGEIEIRSGVLYHKQPIMSPVVHFGLGTYEEAEMLRILWPNGSVQAEFAELGYGSEIFNEQLLKGSCPWIFTFNGDEMEFVTDFLWRTALGLRINAQGEASVVHSIDWVKIDGDQLEPKNGYYDVRITAELWESHFFDHVSLKVVDHPKDSEVMVDERFVLPAPEQKLYPMQRLHPIEKALDQDQTDVTELVREKDGRYVDNFDLKS